MVEAAGAGMAAGAVVGPTGIADSTVGVGGVEAGFVSEAAAGGRTGIETAAVAAVDSTGEAPDTAVESTTCADRDGASPDDGPGGVRADGAAGIDRSISGEAAAGVDGASAAGMDVAGGVSTVAVAVVGVAAAGVASGTAPGVDSLAAAKSTASGRPPESTGVAEVDPTVAAPGRAGIEGSASAATFAKADRASAARADRAEWRVSVAPPITRPLACPAAVASSASTAASAIGTAVAAAVFAPTAG
jgi:hypothetical protein